MMDFTANAGTTQSSYDGAIVPSKIGENGNGIKAGLVRKLGDITDGTSSTLLIGEKYVDPIGAYNSDYKRDGQTYGLCNDDQGYVDGWDNDSICTANGQNGNNVELPKKISITGINPQDDCGFNFGSIHENLNVVFCDGSVHAVNFDINPVVWLRLCVINDGEPTGFED